MNKVDEIVDLPRCARAPCNQRGSFGYRRQPQIESLCHKPDPTVRVWVKDLFERSTRDD